MLKETRRRRRTSTRIRRQAIDALSDHHPRPWCAWCLDYIDAPELEIHHCLAPRHEVEDLFGLEPWGVPVHKSDCHRRCLQHDATTAGIALMRAVGPHNFESRCRQLSGSGLLSDSLLLSWHRFRQLEDEGSRTEVVEPENRLMFAIGDAAGSRMGLMFANYVETSFEDLLSSKHRLYLPNVYTNHDLVRRARSDLHELRTNEPRTHPTRSPFYAKFCRAEATVNPSQKWLDDLSLVAKDAADPVYNGYTARLIEALINEAEQNYVRALATLSRLMSEMVGKDVSWWHRLVLCASYGRLLYLDAPNDRHQRREALWFLIRAQYIAALLDLVGLPILDWRSGGQPKLTAKHPGHAVRWITSAHDLGESELTEIRREAIFGEPPFPSYPRAPRGLQDEIIKTLHLPAVLH